MYVTNKQDMGQLLKRLVFFESIIYYTYVCACVRARVCVSVPQVGLLPLPPPPKHIVDARPGDDDGDYDGNEARSSKHDRTLSIQR